MGEHDDLDNDDVSSRARPWRIQHHSLHTHCVLHSVLDLRHPDLSPNNVYTLENLAITGVMDWQHSTGPLLFLQGSIPDILQNYGDTASDLGQPDRDGLNRASPAMTTSSASLCLRQRDRAFEPSTLPGPRR
ncbi:hypothetical protein T440DRAFT_471058 [Plenodomus tracheiphilus IPT5]|uniref:Protein kinase domain-containing protein n=1 Tax=Plenodomus tracheiphilus IPT5 TaxID=1408161 RepID=A0A6A7AYV6_9PLEO|nr:hypothetical protein T440DRAFT_471058 [Plenodomus tracheiphilus IPT5]